MSTCWFLRPRRTLPAFLAECCFTALAAIRSKASGAVWVGLLLGLGAVLASAPPAHADTFVVTTTDDAGDGVCDAAGVGDGCTLREAIAAANAQPGDDVITFARGVTGTIDLTGALPSLSTDIEIQGPGADVLTVRRSSGGTYRIFTVTSGVTVTLRGLTIANGESTRGSGINNAGTLTVENSTISGSHFRVGIGTSDPHGGIYNRGTLTVKSSTISGNTFSGGIDGCCFSGLFNDDGGTLTVENSTISGNTINGIDIIGGGLYNRGNLTVKSSTISGNGAFSDGGVDANASGIYNEAGTVTVENSIVAGNRRSSSGGFITPSDVTNVGGSVTSNGYNLIGEDDEDLFNAPGDQTGTEVNPLDALLGPLQDNGGPTFTHLPLPGSPALDQGKSPLALDQRGTARPQDLNTLADAPGGDGSDIGAVEVEAAGTPQSGSSLVVNTLEDVNDQTCGQAHCTLREALLTARAQSGDDVIAFAAGLSGTINLTGALPDLSTNVEIQGPGADVLTIRRDTGGDYRLFTVESGVTVTLSGLTLTGGQATGSFPDNAGGGLFNEGTLTIQSSTLSGNTASGPGGGLYNSFGGTLVVESSTISGNDSASQGGGLSLGGMVTVISSTLSGNTVSSGPGGGLSNAGTLVVENSTLSGNSASSGGGLYNDAGTVTLQRSTLSGNTATDGGGLRNEGTLTVENSTLSGNTTTDRGGGLFNFSGTATIESSTITQNRAPSGEGAGIASWSHVSVRTAVTGSIVAGNLQPGGGDGTDVDLSGGATNSFESDGYNLIGSGNATGAFSQTGDQTGVADPGLGSLADNGGPTLTHLPLPGSPAIDQGKSTLPSDQRGQARPTDSDAHPNAEGGDGSDIGAVELTQAELPAAEVLTVAASLWLEGGYDASVGQMRTDLSDVLPETDPYGLGTSVAAGFFTTDPTGERVVDWMHLQLRTGDPATAMTVEAEQAVLLLDDGTLVAPDGAALTFDVVPGSYWFVALHRNHVGVMSAAALDCTSGSCAIDFTAAGSAFGTEAQAELGAAVLGLFGGDYNGDARVTISDFTLYESAFVEAIVGYEAGDGNLDGEVTTKDFTLYQNAFVEAVASQVPSVGAVATARSATNGHH